MNDYVRNNLVIPAIGELAYYGYRKYVRPKLKSAWNYKATAGPLIVSQKINKMPPTKLQKGGSVNQKAYKSDSSSSSAGGLRKAPRKAEYRINKLIRTPGGKQIRVSSRSQMAARSAGRIKSRRYKLRKQDKIAAKGIAHTVEVGKVETTSAQALYLGHTTLTADFIYADFWRLLIKKLMAKTQITVRSFTAVADNMTAGDIFAVEYQTTDGTVATVSHTYAAAQTWDNVVLTFLSSAALKADNVTLRFITFLPTVNTVGTGQDRGNARLNLEYSYMTIYCKSSMKLQNQTIYGTGAGTTEDGVDQTPIYGRVYSGKGTGVNQMGIAGQAITKQLVCDPYGYILGDSTDPSETEPPPQYYFPRVTRGGKLLIEPGHIKTNTLRWQKKYSVNALRKVLVDTLSSLKTRTNFGKFAFFGLERMIQTALPAAGNIKVAFEINHYCAMNMFTKFTDVTAHRIENFFL